MKIIPSLFIIAIGICATNSLQAQESITPQAKTLEIKPADIKQPATPPVEPGSTVAPKTGAENTLAAPAPESKKEENKNVPDKGKTQVLQLEAAPANLIKKETVEIQPLITPNTNTVKAVPVTKAVTKEQ